MSDHVRLSKFLSLVLRHQPEKAGLTLDASGWVEVEALLRGCNAAGVSLTRSLLERIVAESDKHDSPSAKIASASAPIRAIRSKSTSPTSQSLRRISSTTGPRIGFSTPSAPRVSYAATVTMCISRPITPWPSKSAGATVDRSCSTSPRGECMRTDIDFSARQRRLAYGAGAAAVSFRAPVAEPDVRNRTLTAPAFPPRAPCSSAESRSLVRVRSPTLAKIPILLLSSSTQPSDIEDATKFGANAYAIKSGTPQRLEAMLGAIRDEVFSVHQQNSIWPVSFNQCRANSAVGVGR